MCTGHGRLGLVKEDGTPEGLLIGIGACEPRMGEADQPRGPLAGRQEARKANQDQGRSFAIMTGLCIFGDGEAHQQCGVAVVAAQREMMPDVQLSQVQTHLRECAPKGLFLPYGEAECAETSIIGSLAPLQPEVIAPRECGRALERLHDVHCRHDPCFVPVGLLLEAAKCEDEGGRNPMARSELEAVLQQNLAAQERHHRPMRLVDYHPIGQTLIRH